MEFILVTCLVLGIAISVLLCCCEILAHNNKDVPFQLCCVSAYIGQHQKMFESDQYRLHFEKQIQFEFKFCNSTLEMLEIHQNN